MRCSISSNLASAPVAEAPAAAGRPGSGVWQAVLGIAISLAFLVWTVHDVNLAQVGAALRRVHWGLYVASALIVTCTFPLRAVRWRIMLGGNGALPPLKPVWRAIAIGFMANNVLPARAGEVVRAYAAQALIGTRFTTALATVAVERVFDGLVIIFLMTLAIAAPGFPSDARIGGTDVTFSALATWAGAGFAAVLVGLLVFVHAQERALAFADRLARRVLPHRAADFVLRQLHNVTAGLAVLRSPRDAARVLVWSFAVWFVNAASYVVAFRAFNIRGLAPTAALLLQGITALGVAIPSSPGFWGVFEGTARASLSLYGVPPESSVSFAVGVHLGWFIPITVIGLVVLARTGLSLRELRRGVRRA